MTHGRMREFWPLVKVDEQHQMAMPGAKVAGDNLVLWYGSEEGAGLLRVMAGRTPTAPLTERAAA